MDENIIKRNFNTSIVLCILCLVLWQTIFFVHMFEKDMNSGRTVVEYCGLNCVLSNSYVEILIISTSECHSVWRQGL